MRYHSDPHHTAVKRSFRKRPLFRTVTGGQVVCVETWNRRDMNTSFFIFYFYRGTIKAKRCRWGDGVSVPKAYQLLNSLRHMSGWTLSRTRVCVSSRASVLAGLRGRSIARRRIDVRIYVLAMGKVIPFPGGGQWESGLSVPIFMTSFGVCVCGILRWKKQQFDTHSHRERWM